MIFRTEIEQLKRPYTIGYDSNIMMIGSCFTENIGFWLKENLFDIVFNPTGIMYNPVSVFETLNRIMKNKEFTHENLFNHTGLYNSFYHHSRYSESDENVMLENINKDITENHERLKRCNYLFVTLGTSWVFELNEECGELKNAVDKDSYRRVVGNCHKLSDRLFTRRRLSVSEIVDLWSGFLIDLNKFNPDIKVIFTVSPIRHIKDTLHGNQISKSTLLLAIEELNENFENIDYFPAYEILMDDLRDYRFYASDMLHPSETAINYIKEKFSEFYFSNETLMLQKECQKISRALNHRPQNIHRKAYLDFLTQNIQKLELLIKKYNYITFKIPLKEFKHRLGQI